MTVENIRVPASDKERDSILKDMSERGYTLVAVALDCSTTSRIGTERFWSFYFTRTVQEGI